MINRRTTKVNRRQPGGDKISRVVQRRRSDMEAAHSITTDLRKINRPDFHFEESGGAGDYFRGV